MILNKSLDNIVEENVCENDDDQEKERMNDEVQGSTRSTEKWTKICQLPIYMIMMHDDMNAGFPALLPVKM